MCRLRSGISIILVLIILFSISINPAVAKNSGDPDSVVTFHEPETRMSEVKKDPGNKSNKKWLWVLLGAVIVAGGIAVLASGESSNDPEPPTGEYDFSW